MNRLHLATLVALLVSSAPANSVFAQPGQPIFYRQAKPITKIAFAGTEKLIVASLSELIEVWDITKKKRLLDLEDIPERTLPPLKLGPWLAYMTRDLKVSPDGKIAAAAFVRAGTECSVYLWDTATGEQLRSWQGTRSFNGPLAFSPDGKLFVAAERRGGVEWDIVLWDIAKEDIVKRFPIADQAHAVAFSADGKLLATGSYNKRIFQTYEVATGKEIGRFLAQKGPVALTYGSQPLLVSTVGDWPKLTDVVQLWDVATGKETRMSTGHRDCIPMLAITPDGRMLATGGADKTLRLWEFASRSERGRLRGNLTDNEASVYSADFSPDGRFLAVAGGSQAFIPGAVSVWDVYATKKPISSNTDLAKEERENLWQRLADTDATTGFQAVCELIGRPSQAVSILEEGWKRLPRATTKQMQKWIDDLSNDAFATRQSATVNLERFAAAHLDLLRVALKNTDSLETSKRLEMVLGRLNDPERLRRSRMLEVLGQLRTAPARKFLQALANQTEDSHLAREAAASLTRPLPKPVGGAEAAPP